MFLLVSGLIAGLFVGFWLGWACVLVIQRDGHHDDGLWHPDPEPSDLRKVTDSHGRVTHLPNFSTSLMSSLRGLGAEFGPLGVAIAAAELTDKRALVSRLHQPPRSHTPANGFKHLTVPPSKGLTK